MYQDAKGRWCLDYYTPDGKRRRETVGRSKRQADARLAKVKLDKARGQYVDPARAPHFSDFCDQFMQRHGQHKRGYRKADGMMNKFKASFGRLRLTALTAGHIERYRLARLEEPSGRDPRRPVSRTSVNREVETLRAMLNKAVAWGYIATNPASQVEDYPENNRRERFLTREEIRRLLGATKRSGSPILRPAVYMALQTGMRKGELLNLRWTDVKFDANQLLVRESKAGVPRHVPLSRAAHWLLRKLAARAVLAGPGEHVFETPKRDGAWGAASDVKTAWRRALRLARIEEFRFHDLRHTFASHFAMGDGNLYALAKILGHSSPKMTLDRYAHLSPEFVQAQRGVMDVIYSGRRGNGRVGVEQPLSVPVADGGGSEA
jgi:integrase